MPHYFQDNETHENAKWSTYRPVGFVLLFSGAMTKRHNTDPVSRGFADTHTARTRRNPPLMLRPGSSMSKAHIVVRNLSAGPGVLSIAYRRQVLTERKPTKSTRFWSGQSPAVAACKSLTSNFRFPMDGSLPCCSKCISSHYQLRPGLVGLDHLPETIPSIILRIARTQPLLAHRS